MRRRMSPSSAMCCMQAVGEGKNVVRTLRRYRHVRASCVLDVEEPACGQVPDAHGALGWSGTQHQPDVHETRLQMPSVAWNVRFNWLRHYILPIQQRQGIDPECP